MKESYNSPKPVRYMQWSGVCHTPVLLPKRLKRCSWFSVQKLPSAYPTWH